MQIVVKSSKLNGEIIAPPSKSYAHRILISAFLSGGKVKVINAGNSDDVNATLKALKSLGADVSIEGNSVTIERKLIPSSTVIDCNESGSTLRFLLPVVCVLGVNTEFTGKGKLLSRPLGELVATLNNNGANIVSHTVNGKLKSGNFEISASVSSQYITGLMLALPLLDGDSKIKFIGQPVSKGYIDITLEVLKQFGIEIETTDYGYFIKGNQKYKFKDTVTVEGDYSGSAFILSAGAINGKVIVNGLTKTSKQGDKEIVNILKKFGAKVTQTDNSVTVESKNLIGTTVDCKDIPDLAQIIAVVGANAKGTTILENIERLKLKESNRIQAIIDQLTLAKISCEYKNGNLYISGGMPSSADFSGGKDHRTVMGATVLALNADGKSTVTETEYAKKSYVEFFNDIKKLGGEVNVNI